MNEVIFNKAEVLKIIKRYYEKHYFGQAIKVRVVTDKKIVSDSEELLERRIVSNYKVSVKNWFLVSGYLESEGILHKFSKVLTSDELKLIISDALNEKNLEIDDMKINNKLKLTYSYLEDDKIKANFSGVSVVATKKNEKVLMKNHL